jgi:hypothetical protein
LANNRQLKHRCLESGLKLVLVADERLPFTGSSGVTSELTETDRENKLETCLEISSESDLPRHQIGDGFLLAKET